MNVGEKTFTLTNIKNAAFEGVTEIELTFFNDAVYEIELTYSGNYVRWNNLNEFLDSISEKLNLPRKSWELIGKDFSFLSCNEFRMAASVQDYGEHNSSLSVSNSIVSGVISNLANKKYFEELNSNKQKEDSKKKIFKP